MRDALRGLQQRLTEAFPRIAARFGADRLRSEREPKTAVVTGASTRAPVAKAAAPAPAATSSTAAASAPDTTIAAARGESLAAELDRDDPELVAKLQAVDTKSRAYGTALRVLARLGTLESNAPPDRKARAEAEIGPLLRLVDRIRELELRVPAERIVVLDHDMEVLPE